MAETACPWMPRCAEGVCEMPAVFQVEEMKLLSQVIVANSRGGHPIGIVTKWVYQCIKYYTDYEVWGEYEYWSTPVETLARLKEDCEGMAYLVASMLIALQIDAFVVIGDSRWGYHAWVEAYDRSRGQWVCIETTLGVVMPISARDWYNYQPEFYISPEGCYSGSPADAVSAPISSY